MTIVRRRIRSREATATESASRIPARHAVARGVAAFFALFLLYDLFASGGAGFPWWFELRVFPDRAFRAVFAVYAIGLMYYGFNGREPTPLRMTTIALTSLLLLLVLTSIFQWYDLRRDGAFAAPAGIPFLLQIAGVLTVILAGLFQPRAESDQSGGLLPGVIAFDLCVVLVPIAHLYCSGQITDSSGSGTLLIVADGPFDGDASSGPSQTVEAFVSRGEIERVIVAGDAAVLPGWTSWAETLAEGTSVPVEAVDGAESDLAAVERSYRNGSGGLILMAPPVRLAPLLIHTSRREIPVRQIAWTNRRFPLASAMRSLPDWWKAYLFPKRTDDGSSLPTVSLPASPVE